MFVWIKHFITKEKKKHVSVRLSQSDSLGAVSQGQVYVKSGIASACNAVKVKVNAGPGKKYPQNS